MCRVAELDRLLAGRRLERLVPAQLEHVAEELDVLLVVLGDEDAFGHHQLGSRGKREREHAPLAELALDPDAAAVELDQPLRAQAKVGALELFCPEVGLLEILEDPRLVVGRDPWPVRYRDVHLSIHPRRTHDDGPAFRCELDRVREQVDDDLADPALIGLDDLHVRAGLELSPTPIRVARSLTIETSRSSVSRSENGASRA